MRINHCGWLVALAVPLCWAAAAQQPAAVAAREVWARATAPGAKTGVVYLTLTSPVADRLESVTTPAADSATVHETQMDGDIMRMRPMAGLDLPAGQAVTLRPSGLHIMLEGLKAPLKRGQTVALHLVFQHAPPLDTAATVQAAGASGPGGHADMPGMSMAK